MADQDERRRILEMLAAGQISADEAQDLLEAMDAERDSDVISLDIADEIKEAVRASLGGFGKPAKGPKRRITRSLRIEISSSDEGSGRNGRVVVTVPLTLAKFAGKLLPENARERLDDNGIDLHSLLEQLDQDDLPEGRLIDIDSSDPESESGHARIVVEVVG